MKKITNAILAFVCALSLCSCGLNSTYNDTHEYEEPDIPQLLGEANGNPSATKLIFDFAEEIGYYPSSVFGPYCFDMRSHTVHDTDAECVNDIPFESRMSCWVYDCHNLRQVKEALVDNKYLSRFEWQFCPACLPDVGNGKG